MGEYATYLGQRIKIGTCEDMYYLRPDQIHLIHPDAPLSFVHSRFRFPFPDEDDRTPGDFADYDRGLTVWGYTVPAGVEHYRVQFKADAGILVSLPCPYSADGTTGVRYMFNGFRGPARIVQQRVWAGVWATVLACGPCGAKFRLPDLDAAKPLLDAIDQQIALDTADHRTSSATTWRAVAGRILAGYHTTAP
jgi:hypothetical protein